MENRFTSRRNFIKKAAAGSIMTIGIPEILSASIGKEKIKKISLNSDDIILFQGDSITDAFRDKKDLTFNSAKALGSGYAMLAGAELLEKYPKLSLKIFNKGISGNKAHELIERWQKDCIDINPNVISILVGVNNIRHTLAGYYNGTVDSYKEDMIKLMQLTKKTLPDAKLIIGEPFAIRGVKEIDDRWYPEFYEYQKAASEVAEQFDAAFIPYQKIFEEAIKLAPGSYWTDDGVHPTLAGDKLIAKAWLAMLR